MRVPVRSPASGCSGASTVTAVSLVEKPKPAASVIFRWAYDAHSMTIIGADGQPMVARGLYSDKLTGLMAVNLIRAHREELMQASSGKLDHMVIDVVGSLFDQILSDAKVPPQMARQIARLQLPVLRVALNDPGFFSSRKHPVRRFVNRIASLALAYDVQTSTWSVVNDVEAQAAPVAPRVANGAESAR